MVCLPSCRKAPATGLLSDHRPDLFSSAPSCSAFDVTVVQALDFAMMPELVHRRVRQQNQPILTCLLLHVLLLDRKSTRLNSSHVSISYAVFCLKKKQESKTYS